MLLSRRGFDERPFFLAESFHLIGDIVIGLSRCRIGLNSAKGSPCIALRHHVGISGIPRTEHPYPRPRASPPPLRKTFTSLWGGGISNPLMFSTMPIIGTSLSLQNVTDFRESSNATS